MRGFFYTFVQTFKSFIMKKLLLLLVFLVGGCMYSQTVRFSTHFPEETAWNIRGKVLYADYAKSEKGQVKKVIYEYIDPSNKKKYYFITYPSYNLVYTVTVVNGQAVLTQSRKP